MSATLDLHWAILDPPAPGDLVLGFGWSVLDPPAPGDLAVDLSWEITSGEPFDFPLAFGWTIETPAEQDPDCFLVWGGQRVPSRMRITTSDGRFP